MALHGDVIRVLDEVRGVGIQKVGYQIRAAQPPGRTARAAGWSSSAAAKSLELSVAQRRVKERASVTL